VISQLVHYSEIDLDFVNGSDSDFLPLTELTA